MSEEAGAYVYMLRCSDGSYYVGSARKGLERRISEHNAGIFGGYTSFRRPVALVWSQHFLNITDAVAVERQLKGWSRAKKEALIRGDYDTSEISPSDARREFHRTLPVAILRDGRYAASSG